MSVPIIRTTVLVMPAVQILQDPLPVLAIVVIVEMELAARILMNVPLIRTTVLVMPAVQILQDPLAVLAIVVIVEM